MTDAPQPANAELQYSIRSATIDARLWDAAGAQLRSSRTPPTVDARMTAKPALRVSVVAESGLSVWRSCLPQRWVRVVRVNSARLVAHAPASGGQNRSRRQLRGFRRRVVHRLPRRK